MSEVEDLRKAQQKEYGTYVAVEPIDYEGVRAYNVGDPVPVSNVEKHGYLESNSVKKVEAEPAKEASPATPSKDATPTVVHSPPKAPGSK